jgi:hypothetical protein
MIESIQIRNFRGIKTGRIDRFKQFNLFIGPNNSGKSAVLEALYLACTADRKAGLTSDTVTYDVTVAQQDFFGDHPMQRVRGRHNDTEPRASFGEWDQGILRVNLAAPSGPLQTFELSAPGKGFERDAEQTIALFGLEEQKRSQREREEQDDHTFSALALATALMDEKIDSLADRRLIFGWYPSLTYYYQGSAAWLAQGQLPAAQHTLFYDVAKTMGHLPLDFYRRMLSTIPGWTQQIAQRLGHVLNLSKSFTCCFYLLHLVSHGSRAGLLKKIVLL